MLWLHFLLWLCLLLYGCAGEYKSPNYHHWTSHYGVFVTYTNGIKMMTWLDDDGNVNIQWWHDGEIYGRDDHFISVSNKCNRYNKDGEQ